MRGYFPLSPHLDPNRQFRQNLQDLTFKRAGTKLQWTTDKKVMLKSRTATSLLVHDDGRNRIFLVSILVISSAVPIIRDSSNKRGI
jgi:hypothetical protein